MMNKFLAGVGATVLIALIFVFITPFTVMLGWFTGVLLKVFCGNIIATGMNLLFDTNRFTPEVIPYITATLSVLVGYFTTKTTIDQNK
jgi:hypothetical protein